MRSSRFSPSSNAHSFCVRDSFDAPLVVFGFDAEGVGFFLAHHRRNELVEQHRNHHIQQRHAPCRREYGVAFSFRESPLAAWCA